MNLFDAIKGRRSVRRFLTSPVSMDLVNEVLRLASYAPSAGDARPWRFVVLRSLEQLQEAARINPFGQMADKASCGIVVLGDLFKEKQSGFWVQDCAACTSTILLAAHGLGLGAVWTGIYPIKQRVEQFSELLNVPKSIVPFSLVLLGYSDQRPQKIPHRLEMNDVYYDYFGNTTPAEEV